MGKRGASVLMDPQLEGLVREWRASLGEAARLRGLVFASMRIGDRIEVDGGALTKYQASGSARISLQALRRYVSKDVIARCTTRGNDSVGLRWTKKARKRGSDPHASTARTGPTGPAVPDLHVDVPHT